MKESYIMKTAVLRMLLTILLFPVSLYAQSRPTAGRIMGGTADPTGLACNSSTTLTDVYIRAGVAVGSSVFICRSSVYVLFSGGSGSPGGSNTQVQFNDSSAFGGDAGFVYDKTTDTLTISGLLKLGSGPVTISDAAGKILSAALNTVAVGQGGTGLTTVTSNALVKGNGASAMVVTGVTVDSSNNVSTTGTVTSGSGGGVTGDLALSGATSGTGHVTVSAIAGTQTLLLGTSGTITVPSATDTLVGKATADIFTNKTLDAEGTGNLLTQAFKVWLPAAGCSNTTAASFWDLPTSTPAVAACATGTNTQKGVLQYADTSGGFSAQNGFLLPSDFTGTVDANIIWKTTATSGNAKFSLSTICTAVNATETDDPTFNTASTVTVAAPGTANRLQTSPITTVIITGCAAGELLHIKLFRDGNDGSDTLAASLDVIGVEITYRRAQ